MKKKLLRYIYGAVSLFFALLFIAVFGRAAILKAYVRTGIGDCRSIPILCAIPEKEIINPQIDKTYVSELLPYAFPEIEISIPKGFAVTKSRITKGYYKKRKNHEEGSAAYLLYEEPIFFPNLFTRFKGEGIENNYDFLSRTMHADFNDINNVNDVFFIIMKSIFTPNLGKQEHLKMVKFKGEGMRGFINYNLTPSENYFDCNIISADDTFFKVYIKDRGAKLSLDKVLAIVSTLNTAK